MPTPKKPRMAPGTQVGRFIIQEEVGRGGMGVVYRAQDPRLGRLVALKLLAPGRTDRRGRERFEKEASAAARLSHRNIATVYEFGEHEGQLYLALEWIEGETLDQLGRLPPARALDLLEQAAEALDCAHRAGVVHRDVKPSNLMLSGERLVLVDFGLASLIDQASATGSLVGTPHYLAPEIVRGEPVDGRADQYSLAAVLFECVTGRRPFEASNIAALLAEHLHRPPPRADEIVPSLPPSLTPALLRGLDKQPEARYPSVVELCRAARGAPAPATRRRAYGGLAAAAVVAFLVLGRGVDVQPPAPAPVTSPSPVHLALWEAPGGGPQRSNVAPQMGPLHRCWERPAHGKLQGVLTSGNRLVTRWDDGRLECFDATTGHTLWQAHAPTTDWALSEKAVYTTAPEALRLSDGHSLWKRSAPLGGLVAFEGVLIGLTATAPGTLRYIDADTGNVTEVNVADGAYDPGLCATEDALFATSGPGLIAFDQISRQLAWDWTAPAEIDLVIASLNGVGVLVGTTKGHLAALSPMNGTPLWTVRCRGPFAGLACDGFSVVALGREGLLELREPQDGKVRWQVDVGEPVTEPPTMDAENVRVLLPSGKVRLFSLEDGKAGPEQVLGKGLVAAGACVVRVEGGKMELWCP